MEMKQKRSGEEKKSDNRVDEKYTKYGIKSARLMLKWVLE